MRPAETRAASQFSGYSSSSVSSPCHDGWRTQNPRSKLAGMVMDSLVSGAFGVNTSYARSRTGRKREHEDFPRGSGAPVPYNRRPDAPLPPAGGAGGSVVAGDQWPVRAATTGASTAS